MDELERKILRRRRSAFSDSLVVTNVILDDLRGAGLLTDEMVDGIKAERTAAGRATRLVDAVIACPEQDAFQALCAVLEPHAQWEARVLEADLRIERGLVIVDDQIMREAGIVVHRKFGSSKRFSEGEKREMQELLALKLQVSKEEWQRELDRVNLQLQEQQGVNHHNDRLAKDIAGILTSFAKDNAKKLTTYAHGMTSTTQALQLSVDDSNKEVLEKFRENLKKVLDRFTKILTHREKVVNERERCLRLLKADSGKNQLDLETAIRQMMNTHGSVPPILKANSTLTNGSTENGFKVPSRPMTAFAGNDASDKERTIKRLNKKISDLENEIDSMEIKIQELESQLQIRDEEVEQLRVSKKI